MNYNYSNEDFHREYSSDEKSAADGESLGQKLADGLNDKGEQVRHAAANVAAQVGDLKETGSDHARRLLEDSGYKAQRLQHQMQSFFEEQPLMVGALGIALGAALGAALPTSDQEDRLFGSASDQLTDEALATADKYYDKARDAVKETVSDVEETLADNAKQFEKDTAVAETST